MSVASLCRCPSSVVRVWCQSDFREISCLLPKLGYSFHFAAMDDTWTDMPALQSTRETQAQAVLDRDSRLRSVPQLVAMNPFPSFKFCASGVADHTWISAGASSLNDVPGRTWADEYILIEQTLQPKDILYLKYEDLKNPLTRVSALNHVAMFLGSDIESTTLYCSFILADNPGAKRKINNDMMKKDDAYTKPLICKMWALFGKYASRIGYQRRGHEDFDCPEATEPIPMVNVGPQGDYNDHWVKAGQPFMDFGDHPPDGPNAGKRLFGPGGEWPPPSPS